MDHAASPGDDRATSAGLLRVCRVAKQYADGQVGCTALHDVNLSLAAGEFAVLCGPSGCGKSTLLHIVGAMDRPTSGEVWLRDTRLDLLGPEELAQVRRRRVGFVFQLFNLLPTLSAVENVALPLALDGVADRTALVRARAALDDVGMAQRAKHRPWQLSGGEMQRVAVARALACEPDLLVADEPTGSLDSENGHRVLELLAHVNRSRGLTVLMATHDAEAAGYASRRFSMRDGRLEGAGAADGLPAAV